MRAMLVVDVVVEAGGLAMPTEHWPLPSPVTKNIGIKY